MGDRRALPQGQAAPKQHSYAFIIHGENRFNKLQKLLVPREGIAKKCEGAEIISVKEMESNEEVWADWLKQDNEYAVGDRKSMEAGGGKYLNFISIVLRKKITKEV